MVPGTSQRFAPLRLETGPWPALAHNRTSCLHGLAVARRTLPEHYMRLPLALVLLLS